MKTTKETIYKELKKVLKAFEEMEADTEELYEMLCKIESNWDVITKS